MCNTLPNDGFLPSNLLFWLFMEHTPPLTYRHQTKMNVLMLLCPINQSFRLGYYHDLLGLHVRYKSRYKRHVIPRRRTPKLRPSPAPKKPKTNNESTSKTTSSKTGHNSSETENDVAPDTSDDKASVPRTTFVGVVSQLFESLFTVDVPAATSVLSDDEEYLPSVKRFRRMSLPEGGFRHFS